MDYGRRIGLIGAKNFEEFRLYRHRVANALMSRGKLGSPMKPFLEENSDPLHAFDISKGPWSENQEAYQIWVQHKYQGYLAKQEADIAKFRKLESKRIPEDFDTSKIPGLLLETREKFRKIKPVTVGQASRIPGIPPSDIGILLIYLKRFTEISKHPLKKSVSVDEQRGKK